ncbi:M48 family metallopeptidase [Pacificoceanicola onchidii]|uniref:M48 family metallopeptidase n=1 Tax=Pacificoceanicola onchidii TaxID=2562685 RepID=UPI0010A33402|nr:M48 family metallopeptidase [Pacificoceanicola onchidii]
MHRLIPLLLLVLAACTEMPAPTTPAPQDSPDTKVQTDVRVRAGAAAQRFVTVVETVEPVAERVCRERTRGMNCNFQIVVDDRPGEPANAFQTIDETGRPIIGFNIALIATARNADELAFILGHEAAHHVLDHISKTVQSATVGAVIFSGIAALGGADAEAVRSAEELGATVGARTYSKEFELEADQLGTIIAARAGYDPVRGSAFFTRIPDPGNRFLGSHPPNAARVEIVRKTYAAFKAGNI